jgi:PAS domain S-box-containing protein
MADQSSRARGVSLIPSELADLLERFLQLPSDESAFALDPQGRIAAWTAAAERVTGYPAGEVIGRHLSILYSPEDVALGTPQRELSRAERDGGMESEGWQVRRGGDRIWVRVSTRALRDPAGALTGFVRVHRDTTEQLRAEQALRFSETKFSGMIAIASDAIVSTDEEQRIILFNRGAEEAFGYPADEVIGKPLELLLPEGARPSHHEHVASFGRGEQTARAMGRHRSEIRGRRRDGSEFPAEASISRLDIEGRRIYTAVLRDVSERHEAEQRIADLLAAEQEARAHAEVAEHRAQLLADAGSVLGATLDRSVALRQLAELATSRLGGGCFIYLIEDEAIRLVEAAAPGVGPVEREALLAAQAIEPAGSHPAAQVMRDGEARVLTGDELPSEAAAPSGAAAPLPGTAGNLGALILTPPDDGSAEADLALARELGRRVGIALENTRLYREAREATGARDDMLYAVSHDLGNSLGAVMVATAVLARTLPEDTAPAARERVAAIRVLAEQMQRLRQDLLDAASVDAGRLRIDPEVQDAGELIAQAAEQYAPMAEERGLSLRAAVEGDPGPVHADAARVHQVLGNLLSNAIKFTPAGGEIRIGAALRGEAVLLSVSDTGSGIDEADLPHVFDRFWRTREANRLGTGLGLAIARGIVEAHGGRIWVESRKGVGTTFTFSLPRPTV